jgi:hypothetical protein
VPTAIDTHFNELLAHKKGNEPKLRAAPLNVEIKQSEIQKTHAMNPLRVCLLNTKGFLSLKNRNIELTKEFPNFILVFFKLLI